MSIVAVLLATSMAAAPPPPRETVFSQPRPKDCAADRIVPAVRTPASAMRRLGDLPRGHMQHAVLRTIDGCPVSTVVRENVEFDGRFARPRGEAP